MARLAGVTLLRKLGVTLGTLFFVSLVVYGTTQVIPANPAKVFLGKTASKEQVAAYDRREGLDRGPVSGYLFWAGRFVRGNWGVSLESQQPVTQVVLPPLRRT